MAVHNLNIVNPGGIPTQSEDDRKKVKRLHAIFEDSRAAKNEATKSWENSWNFYRGHHWNKSRPSWKASPRIPITYSKVETIIPIMTDSRPRVHVLPRNPKYQQYADVMQRMMDYEWDRQGMDANVEMNTKNTLIYSDGIMYPWYDAQKERPVTDVVPPQNVFPDARATSLDDACVFTHRTLLPRSEILRRWPKSDSKRVIPGSRFQGQGIEDIAPTPWAGRQGAIAGTYSGESLVVQEVPGRAESEAEREIEVMMFWVRDQELIEADAFDPLTGTPIDDMGRRVRVDQLKFPYGRLIVVAGEEVVFDGPNPYEHGRWPYIKQTAHPVNGAFWSISFVENLVPINRYVNKLLGIILDNAALMASGQWKVSKNAGVDTKMLTGEPGLAVLYNALAGGIVDKIPGVPLPAYVMNTLEMLIRLADDTTGVFDVTQGKKPVGITAGVAIEQLQEAAHTRVRLLTRHQEDAIRAWGEMTLALHQQFLQEPKLIRTHDPETGKTEFTVITPEIVRAGWEIMVVAGSTLPRSRDARQREALELFGAGLFDKEEALNYIEHPGREKVLARLRKQEQAQAAMALAGAGGGGGGGGGNDVQSFGSRPQRRPQVSSRGGGFNNQGLNI